MNLCVKNLSYNSILNNISVEFQENCINYITGPNKCGKTTFIKALSGFADVKESIYYKNEDIYNFNSCQLSMVFGSVFYQDSTSFTYSNVEQELKYKLDKLDLKKEESKKRYNEIVRLLELKQCLYQDISRLSSINRIKLLIALELLKKPNILFLDDIFLDIDFETARNLLLKLKSIDNLTIILTSSNLDLSIESSQIIILNKGELVLNGDKYTVLKEDSLLNKIGLELPFMIDLSIKLKYYNLLDNIELDMDRMVEKLWK